jgi:hypothetical protein
MDKVKKKDNTTTRERRKDLKMLLQGICITSEETECYLKMDLN